MRLEGGSLKSDFLRFVIPSVLAQWVYTLYTMVDGMFVSIGVSEIALTAVNLANPFMQGMFALSLMFAVGTSTIISILLGGGEERRASEVFTQNVALQTALALGITVAVLGNCRSFAVFLGAEEGQTLDFVMEYLRWIAPFSFVFILAYSLEIIIKTDGFPQKAIVIVTLGAVENCILDWLFVFVLRKGVAGAAFATGISQLTVFLLYLLHFLWGRGTIHFARFKFSPALVLRQIRNGSSAGLTKLSSGIVTFAFNRTILAVLDQDALVG